MAADIAGFSRLVGIDEEATLAAQRGHRKELIEPLLAEHQGRIANTAGDSFLFEFSSAVEAVRCSIAVQEGMASRNSRVPKDRRIEFRVGINVGDVVADGDDLLGDGVNIAARLEALADAGGVCISQTVLEHVRDRIDVSFDDLGEVEVKNIARPVRIWRWSQKGQVDAPAMEAIGDGEALALPDKPSVAVLPFDNMSGDAEQEYFSDGMAEDLITDLSKISNLYVAARNSSFSFKGQMRDIKEVAEKLGVSFILKGSVRKMNQRLRINAQLIEAADGGHIWAERYDGAMDDIFEFQDRITGEIVAALKLKLTPLDMEKAGRKRTENVEAYDLYLKGRLHYFRNTPDDNIEAGNCLKQAISLDQNFAEAFSYLSCCFIQAWLFQWPGFEEGIDRSLELAQKGLELDPDSPIALHRLGWNQLFYQQYDEAIVNFERALSLDPDNGEVHAYYAETLNSDGDPDSALEHLDIAFRRDPFCPPSWLFMKGHSYFILGQNDLALDLMRQTIERAPDFQIAHLFLACIYVEAEQLDNANAEIGEILRTAPQYVLADAIRVYPYRHKENQDRLINGLRAAGIPE